MIDQDLTYRPRVPHETRRLLIAALIALFSVWALARVRFPERAAANPVAPLLSQLTPRIRLEDLAAPLAELRPRIEGLIQPLAGVIALRAKDGIGVALAGASADLPGVVIRGMDRASGLLVIETTSTGSVPSNMTLWHAGRLDQPRYLITARAAPTGVWLGPAFTSSLDPVSHPMWPGPVWAIAAGPGLSPGSFAFTEDAQLVGLVWTDGDLLAIIPAAILLTETDRLLATGTHPPGWLGIEVSSLTPSLARATGASMGVIVTRIDARAPWFATLRIGDIIERVDDVVMHSVLDWNARERRIVVGQTFKLHVLRNGTVHGVPVTAVSPPKAANLPLGLDLRRVKEGSEVVHVEPGSVAHAAGVRVGDVIVQAGDVAAPAPARMRRLFAGSDARRPIVIAVARGDTNRLMTLERDAPERP
jgi:hypothetical protein